jgi:hypothetical protein
MKLTRFAFIVALASTFAFGTEGEGKLVGSWVGFREGDKVTMIFGAKSIQMKVGDEGGAGTYVVDWTKSPVALDIDWGSHGKVTTIIALKGDTLKMENAEPGAARPKEITGRALVMKRTKP